MKKQLSLWMLMVLAAPAGAADWKLVWSDEFERPGPPDPAKWNYEEGFIRNNEAQYYTRGRPENARVENGMLIIEARKEHWVNPKYEPDAAGKSRRRQNREAAEYTSASLTTRGLAAWTYGRRGGPGRQSGCSGPTSRRSVGPRAGKLISWNSWASMPA